jgi:hypothetical protein
MGYTAGCWQCKERCNNLNTSHVNTSHNVNTFHNPRLAYNEGGGGTVSTGNNDGMLRRHDRDDRDLTQSLEAAFSEITPKTQDLVGVLGGEDGVVTVDDLAFGMRHGL